MHVSFVPNAEKQDVWDILIEGEKWREVHRTIFGYKPIFPTLTSKQQMQVIFDTYEYQRVKKYTLWRLSKQSYHSAQIAKLLRQRLVQSKTIEEVLQECQTIGLLDDTAWVQTFIRAHEKKYGLPFILTKLRSKGIPLAQIQQIVNDTNKPEQELQIIQNLLATRYRKKDLTQFKIRQKVIASLLRKGFSFENVHKVINS